MFIDIAFAILALIAISKGLRKGLVVALFSLAGWIIGLVAALKLSAVVSMHLQKNAAMGGKWLPALSFLIVFLGVILLVRLGASMIEKAVETLMLGWINKLAGSAVYLLLYGLIFSVFLFYLVEMKIISSETVNASAVYPLLAPIAPTVINSIGEVIPLFKDIFVQLSDFFESVANKMAH